MNLSGRRLGKFTHKGDLTRKFVLTQSVAREVFQLIDIFFAGRTVGNDERFCDLPAGCVRHPDDSRFPDVRMLEQCVLDLDRTHRPTGRDDHVVPAADEPEVAVVVAACAIARQIPLAAAARRGRGRILPVLEEERRWLPAEPFGILDRAEPSVALWSRGELLAYGGASAMRALAQAYADWTSCGLPGLAGFALQVVRIGSAPMGNGRVWTEPRGGTALVWRLLPDAQDWQALLRDAP